MDTEDKVSVCQPKWPNMTLRQKLGFLYKNIKLEPMVACYIPPLAISGLAYQTLILEKACRVDLHYSKTVCDNLAARRVGNHTQEEFNVQQAVAGMAVWTTIIQSVFPAIILMFLGSWSDRTGKRKICMLLPIMGELAKAVALILSTYFFNEVPMRITAFMHALLPAICGGWFAFFMGAYSFLAETTSPEMRTVRIGALSVFSSASGPFGTALSGVLIKWMGLEGVFMLSAGFYILAIVWCCLRIRDVTRPVPANNVEDGKGPQADSENQSQPNCCVKKCRVWKDVFKPKYFLHTLEMIFKNGSKEQRVKIILLIVVLAVVYGPQYGTSFAVWVFSHMMKIDDALIGVMSCCSKILAGFVYAFARTRGQVYMAPIVDIINGTSFIAMRSIASKVVPAEAQGKLQSLYGACESLTQLIYGPMYAFVYTQTLHLLPGAYYLLGSALIFPAILIFGWMYNENRKQLKQQSKDINMTSSTTIEGNVNKAFEPEPEVTSADPNAEDLGPTRV